MKCQYLHVGAKCSKDMKDCRRTVRCFLTTAELLLRFIDPCPFTGNPTFKAGLESLYYSYNKSQQDALFLYFGKELNMFRTDLLSIFRSLNKVFTAIAVYTVLRLLLMDISLSETCRVLYQNKVEK